MSKENPLDASILRILSMSSSSKKKPDAEEIIRRALKSDVIKKPPPKENFVTLHFKILKGRKALPKLKYKWLDMDHQKLPVYGPYSTNEKGQGMVCIKESALNKLNKCQLEITENKTLGIIPDINLKAFRNNVEITGDKGYSIMFEEPVEIPKKKENKKMTPFSIAVSGDSKQLKKAIPLLKKQTCIKVEKVFAYTKEVKKVNLKDHDIRIETISKDITGKLKGIDILLDLSNHADIKVLSREQMFGKRKTKTIIIPDSARFTGREEKVLSYFEAKPKSVPDWEKIVMQLQKTNKK